MEHVEMVEAKIPIVASSKNHEWRKATVVGVFLLLTSSYLLYFFSTATNDYESYSGNDCYSDGTYAYDSDEAGTTNVTS